MLIGETWWQNVPTAEAIVRSLVARLEHVLDKTGATTRTDVKRVVDGMIEDVLREGAEIGRAHV